MIRYASARQEFDPSPSWTSSSPPRSSPMSFDLLLEVTIISAQDLKPPSTKLLRPLHAYATISLSSAVDRPRPKSNPKLRTGVDRVGSSNPTWNDKFLFRLPPTSLSSAALTIDFFAAGPRLVRDVALGSVHLLLGNHADLLLGRPRDLHLVASLGIRQYSGCFHGILTIALALLSSVPSLAAQALASANAVSYPDLILRSPLREVCSMPALTRVSSSEDKDEEHVEIGVEKENRLPMQQLCGLGMAMGMMGFQRRAQLMKMHSSSSDHNLRWFNSS